MGQKITRTETIAFANNKLKSCFSWGYNDCNTMVLEYLSRISPKANEVYTNVIGQYSSYKEAIKFFKQTSYQWNIVLVEAGYTVTNTFPTLGNILKHSFNKRRSVESLSICLGHFSMIANPKYGIVLKKTSSLLEYSDLKVYSMR